MKGIFSSPDTKYLGSFPIPLLQLSDIHWMSNNSIPFWYCQPGVSTRTCKLKCSIQQDCLHFRCQSQVQATGTSDQTIYKYGVPMCPSSGLIFCLTSSQNSGSFNKWYKLGRVLVVCYKGYKLAIPKYKRCIGQGVGVCVCRTSLHSLGALLFQHLSVFTNPETSASVFVWICVHAWMWGITNYT